MTNPQSCSLEHHKLIVDRLVWAIQRDEEAPKMASKKVNDTCEVCYIEPLYIETETFTYPVLNYFICRRSTPTDPGWNRPHA